MKKISITQIDDANDKLQPFTGLSLAFLQNYLDEDKAVIIKSIIISTIGSYSLTTPYVISGCIVSDSGKDVTNGEIFYNGKFYEVVGVNGTINIAQFSVVTLQPTAVKSSSLTLEVRRMLQDKLSPNGITVICS